LLLINVLSSAEKLCAFKSIFPDVSRRFLHTPAGRAIILLAFVGGLALWVFWPRGLAPPVEPNRAMHPSGYSIIVPLGWESKADVADARDTYAKDRLNLRPIKDGLWQPAMSVVRLRHAPDAAALKADDHFVDGKFLGVDALIRDHPIKKYWVWKAIFPRDSEWFEVSVSLPDFEKVPESSWYPYLTSFKYPDPKYNPATTQPNSIPSTSPTTFHIDFGK
jgi:hypothetical protein